MEVGACLPLSARLDLSQYYSSTSVGSAAIARQRGHGQTGRSHLDSFKFLSSVGDVTLAKDLSRFSSISASFLLHHIDQGRRTVGALSLFYGHQSLVVPFTVTRDSIGELQAELKFFCVKFAFDLKFTEDLVRVPGHCGQVESLKWGIQNLFVLVIY
jgi:hypothetical protein